MPKHLRTPRHKRPPTGFWAYIVNWFGMVWDELLDACRLIFSN